ncbi:MAG: hypothetical protein ACTSUQ_14165 [Candidatus Freyarchaeota archaeon]
MGTVSHETSYAISCIVVSTLSEHIESPRRKKPFKKHNSVGVMREGSPRASVGGGDFSKVQIAWVEKDDWLVLKNFEGF